MKFNAQEIRYIERLRKLERTWRWGRWLALSCGAVTALPLVLLGSRLISLMNGLEANGFPASSVAEIAILCPGCYILLGITVSFPLHALLTWTGDPSRVLLLRLLDSEREESHGTKVG
jgi:hypothetical protein